MDALAQRLWRGQTARASSSHCSYKSSKARADALRAMEEATSAPNPSCNLTNDTTSGCKKQEKRTYVEEKGAGTW